VGAGTLATTQYRRLRVGFHIEKKWKKINSRNKFDLKFEIIEFAMIYYDIVT
jgi:hypothetical protein